MIFSTKWCNRFLHPKLRTKVPVFLLWCIQFIVIVLVFHASTLKNCTWNAFGLSSLPMSCVSLIGVSTDTSASDVWLMSVQFELCSWSLKSRCINVNQNNLIFPSVHLLLQLILSCCTLFLFWWLLVRNPSYMSKIAVVTLPISNSPVGSNSVDSTPVWLDELFFPQLGEVLPTLKLTMTMHLNGH